MITGKMGNLARYLGCHPNLDAAIEFLLDSDFSELEDGRHDVGGQRFHINIFRVCMGENAVWEAHRDFIDLQIILEGAETVAWAPVDQLEGWSDYNADKDARTSADARPGMLCSLMAGMFAVYFPEDAHRPGIGSGEVRKAVVKVRATPETEAQNDESMLKHLGTSTLETGRLRLRQYQADDAQVMFDNWTGDPEVTKTLMWETHPNAEYTRHLLENWIKSYETGRYYHWAIEHIGQVIGDIALVNWSPERLDGEIGYCLTRKFWNRGIMTEALKAVMRYLFQEVGFRRLILRHATNNPASGRVMEKAGLIYEGCLRQALPDKQGGFSDLALYAALKDEWLKQ
ncbi:MAG: YhcH/YjgK/YiaL family protein [Eubacteriales bacterium]|nr:YhcH/YjgK/YiaL family protein [Eubacteriales bacterium]